MQESYYQGNHIKGLVEMVQEMRRKWTGIVHHAGNGSRLHDSHCLARIYSDGLRAVVLLTELKGNKGTSVTNAYEVIAKELRHAVKQFIQDGNFPGQVTWLEQYEDSPTQIALVTLRWSGENCLSPPSWKHGSQRLIEALGLSWEEVCHVPQY